MNTIMQSSRPRSVAVYLALGAGALLLAFVTPLALLPGYIVMGVVFGLTGVALLGAAVLAGVSVRMMPLALLGVAVLTFCTYGLTCRGVGLFKHREGVAMDGVLTIADAVNRCRESGLQEWPVVAYAQSLVAHKMSYSRVNPWDSPAVSFQQGQGYCMQQAQALEQIYRGLDIPCRLVYADRCRFWSADLTHSVVISHAWLKVNLNGEEKDVCPGSVNNFPGFTDFDILSQPKTLMPAFRPLAHIAFVLGNITRDPRNS
jgi:hypothetical protein